MTYSERQEQLKQLAFIDESEAYQIDEAGIYFNAETTEFVLLTASGCSCWDGEYDEEVFESLEALEASLLKEDRRYNPSLEGAKKLIAEARTAL